jgi:hypothetical protein
LPNLPPLPFLPGQYFYSTRAAIQYYPEWTSFQELYQRASQSSKALQDAFAGRSAFTYLLPNNDALRPAMQVCVDTGSTTSVCGVLVDTTGIVLRVVTSGAHQRTLKHSSHYAHAVAPSLNTPVPALTPLPPLQVLSKAGVSDLSQLLEYHVLPEMRPVPTGWKNDATVNTLLKDRTLKSQLSQR